VVVTCEACEEVVCEECTEVICEACEDVICEEEETIVEEVCVPVEYQATTCPSYTEEAIYRYDIYVPKSIDGYSWTFAEPVATSTAATIEAKSAEETGE
jgi:hypothetical protein